MHDLIFANQKQLEPEKFFEHATALGLDLDKFKKDYESEAIKKRVDADAKEAANIGLTGTPAFFINGRYIAGAKPFETFKELIDLELEKASGP